VDFHTTKNSSSHEPQNFSQKTTSFKNKKKSYHLIILISDLSFFQKIVPHLSQKFVFSFFEIFRQTKNFRKK